MDGIPDIDTQTLRIVAIAIEQEEFCGDGAGFLRRLADLIEERRGILPMALPLSGKHGRDCACSPCQAEDWDAIDRGLAWTKPA